MPREKAFTWLCLRQRVSFRSVFYDTQVLIGGGFDDKMTEKSQEAVRPARIMQHPNSCPKPFKKSYLALSFHITARTLDARRENSYKHRNLAGRDPTDR